jgi:hypothetical protein
MLRGGVRVGREEGRVRARTPLPLLQLESKPPLPVPSATTPRKPGETQSRGAKGGGEAGS